MRCLSLRSSLLAACLAFPLAAQAPPPLRLQPDTPVDLRLRKALSSARARAGERVEFDVSDDVRVGSTVVIPRGSLAWGQVTDAAPRGRLSRSGRLSVAIVGVCLPDGRRGGLTAQSRGNGAENLYWGPDTPSDGYLALPALPVLIFMYGRDVTVPPGKPVAAFVRDPIDFRPESLAGRGANTSCLASQDIAAPAEAARAAEAATASISLRSSPDGAEILVDGRYAGDTPAVLKLAPGDHRLAISKPGFRPFERNLLVTPGSQLTIAPALEPISFDKGK